MKNNYYVIKTRKEMNADQDFVSCGFDVSSQENGDKLHIYSKAYLTFDSLQYEQERLNTFLNWPLQWPSATSLAKEGFYYLKEKDIVSCAFCYGNVGSWEYDDVPRQEHKRHFPICKFMRGLPVGNIPIVLGNLLPPVQQIISTSDKCGM